MRYVPGALLAGGVGFAVSFLAACGGGGSGLLSGDQANTLNAQLDQVSSAVSSRNCAAAAQASQSFGNQVANLPQTVNTTLRANLSQGASTVAVLASHDCRKPLTPTTPTTTTAASTSATSTSTSTTQTTTTTTTTQTRPTTTTTTSSTTTTTSSGGGGLPGGQGGAGGGAGAGAGGGNSQ